ncbi:MAG TPA: gliding motility-associated C-terminal domain-containing protein, partial [Saprospiraceae bacterium]|nr:gliding motility-associated C-terminal domain-containing protein [Saprospiraceae bacterium]
SVTIVEPPDVGIRLIDVLDLLCNGMPTGEIRIEGNGGRPPYTFSPDGLTYFPSDTLRGLAAGDYWVKIRDAGGCLDSVFATLQQPPPLQVLATPSDTTLKLGYTVDIQTLTAPAGRPVSFEWTPSAGLDFSDRPNPIARAIDNQTYVVKITDEDGCMAWDTVRIWVDKDRPIYIPNVFAPAKHYPNDHFTLFGGPAADKVLLLRIYDRWGSLIYETHNIDLNEPNLGWDGRYKGEDVYGVFTFYATVRFVDSSQAQYEGSVTVVR